VSDACIRAYEEIRNSKNHRFGIFKIVDHKVDIDQLGKRMSYLIYNRWLSNLFLKGSRDATYDDFLAGLKVGDGKECRYGVFDFEYKYQHQGTISVHYITQCIFVIENTNKSVINLLGGLETQTLFNVVVSRHSLRSE